MKEPSFHLAALQALSDSNHSVRLVPELVALISDYSTAFGYIEGSKAGMERLLKECEFWKDVAMKPVKTRQFVKREKP